MLSSGHRRHDCAAGTSQAWGSHGSCSCLAQLGKAMPPSHGAPCPGKTALLSAVLELLLLLPLPPPLPPLLPPIRHAAAFRSWACCCRSPSMAARLQSRRSQLSGPRRQLSTAWTPPARRQQPARRYAGRAMQTQWTSWWRPGRGSWHERDVALTAGTQARRLSFASACGWRAAWRAA